MVTAKQPTPLPPALVVAARIVAALDAAHLDDAATIARTVAGLPPRQLTPDEQFVNAVRTLVTGGGTAVGFNCDSADECERRVALVRAMAPMSNDRRYAVKVTNTRLEVTLG